MIKDFNWGHGIAIFYIIFVAIVLTALIASFSVDRSLVVDEYYNEDLAYQAKYNKKENVLYSSNFDINTHGNDVVISFLGAKSVSGSIHFYRASDKSQDFKRIISSPEEKFAKNKLSHGKWSIKVDWKIDGISYYKEEVIYI